MSRHSGRHCSGPRVVRQRRELPSLSVSFSLKTSVFGLQFSIFSVQKIISQEKSFALKVSSKLALKSKFTLQSFCVSSQIYSSFCSSLSSK